MTVNVQKKRLKMSTSLQQTETKHSYWTSHTICCVCVCVRVYIPLFLPYINWGTVNLNVTPLPAPPSRDSTSCSWKLSIGLSLRTRLQHSNHLYTLSFYLYFPVKAFLSIYRTLTCRPVLHWYTNYGSVTERIRKSTGRRNTK